MRVEHDNPRDESIPVDAPREGDRAGDEPPGPVATQESDVAGERPGEAPDDEAVLEDVDSGEFPPESGETAGHAEEDAWLRSESAPADEVSVGEPASGEPAVGVAAVPAPGAVTAPEAVPVTAVPPAPRSAGFGTGNGGSRDGGSV